MRYSSLLLLFLAAIILNSCKKENNSPIVECQEDLSTLSSFLSEKNEQNILLTNVEEINGVYHFTFENGETQQFANSCFERIDKNEAEWNYSIRLSNGDQLTVGTIGQLDISTIVNPEGHSPLVAQLNLTAKRKGKVFIKVIGKNGPFSDASHQFDDYATQHSVPVMGLYPEHNNQVEVSFTDANGNIRITENITIELGSIPNLFPEITVDVRKEAAMEEHFVLVSNRRPYEGGDKPYIFDAFGDIRWFFNFQNHPELNSLGYDAGIERLKNGNFYFGNWSTSTIYEVDVYGKIVNRWAFPGYGFHHNVQEKADGNFLVTVNKWGSLHDNGNNAVEDVIIEIDRQTGNIVAEWDLKESLDEYRTAWVHVLSNEYVDWFHANAVIDDPSDNTIIVSGRHQGLVKLDYNNQVQWIMGPHFGWGQNRMGQDLNEYLLTPIDATGNAITDTDYLNGFDNHPDFEWNWYQHAPLILPNGNLMLFDNGDVRNFTYDERYSRAVEYKINKEEGTVQQIWQYGKERGVETFSSIVSDVDYLPNKNNILFSPGAYVNNQPDGFGAKVVELNFATKEVVFEAKIESDGIVLHRAEKINLYPQ